MSPEIPITGVKRNQMETREPRIGRRYDTKKTTTKQKAQITIVMQEGTRKQRYLEKNE